MKIEKLPSGSYRVRKTINGKRESFIFDHKPTQKEVNDLIIAKQSDTTLASINDTFSACVESYFKAVGDSLSPSTLKGYTNDNKRLSEAFKGHKINDITALTIQKEMNRLAAEKYAPKTIKNTNGFISTIMTMYRPEFNPHIVIPKGVPFEPNTPTDIAIKAVLEDLKDTKYYIPVMLGCYGLRRSEVMALTLDDLHDNYITVNKSRVFGPDNKPVIKPFPKNDTSIRDVYISDTLRERIIANKGIYDGAESTLWSNLSKSLKRHNLEHFRFHDLRGYYSSMAHAEGIPDKYIQKNCGWKTDYAMKKHYQRAMRDKLEPMAMKAIAHIDNLQ